MAQPRPCKVLKAEANHPTGPVAGTMCSTLCTSALRPQTAEVIMTRMLGGGQMLSTSAAYAVVVLSRLHAMTGMLTLCVSLHNWYTLLLCTAGEETLPDDLQMHEETRRHCPPLQWSMCLPIYLHCRLHCHYPKRQEIWLYSSVNYLNWFGGTPSEIITASSFCISYLIVQSKSLLMIVYSSRYKHRT